MVALQVVPQVAARIRTPRDGLSAAMSSAATMLGRPLSYEQAYAVSGHAFVPCVDPTHPCKSLWRVDDRTDGMLHVCARVGIVAHGFHRPGESSHAIASLRLDPEKAASHRAALAKPFRLALETGGVVIGHNSWVSTDDEADVRGAFGVVSDVTDAGDVHGVVVGDDGDRRIKWHGRNWALHGDAAPAPSVRVDRRALEDIVARLQANGAHDDGRAYGIAAVQAWADAMAGVPFCEACGEESWVCASVYARSVAAGARTAARHLDGLRGSFHADAADGLARAGECYLRVATLLGPATRDANRAGYEATFGPDGDGRAHVHTLHDVRDQLALAADALDVALGR